MRSIDPQRPVWRRSSRCAHGDCIEVAALPTSPLVAVRDSKRGGNGPELVFAPAKWQSFLEDVKGGRAGTR